MNEVLMKFSKPYRFARTLCLGFPALLWLLPGSLLADEASVDLAPQMDPASDPGDTEDEIVGLQAAVDPGRNQSPEAMAPSPTPMRMEPRPFINERDPFSLSGVQRKAENVTETGLRFTRQPGGRIPRLILRGIARGADNIRIGLIEIGAEGVYMVQEGDTVSLRPSGQGGNTVLSIKEIGEITMIVESGTLGEVIIVR